MKVVELSAGPSRQIGTQPQCRQHFSTLDSYTIASRDPVGGKKTWGQKTEEEVEEGSGTHKREKKEKRGRIWPLGGHSQRIQRANVNASWRTENRISIRAGSTVHPCHAARAERDDRPINTQATTGTHKHKRLSGWRRNAVFLQRPCSLCSWIHFFFFFFFFNCVSWLIVIFIAILLLCETSQSQNATFLPVQTTAAVERQDAEGMLRFFWEPGF